MCINNDYNNVSINDKYHKKANNYPYIDDEDKLKYWMPKDILKQSFSDENILQFYK